MDGNLKVEIVSRVDAAWNERARTMPGASIFQTSHWADYMQAYLGARPHYIVGRENGEVAMQLLLLGSLRGRESMSGRFIGPLRVVEPFLRVLEWREGPLVRSSARRDPALTACLQVVQEAAAGLGATGVEGAYLPIGEGCASDDALLAPLGYPDSSDEARCSIRSAAPALRSLEQPERRCRPDAGAEGEAAGPDFS